MLPSLLPTGASGSGNQSTFALHHRLDFLPDPQAHGSLFPTFGALEILRPSLFHLLIVDGFHYCFSLSKGSVTATPSLHLCVGMHPDTSAPTQNAFPSATPVRCLSSPEAFVPPTSRKGYRRVMRPMDRPPRPSKIVFTGFWGMLAGQRGGSNPAFLDEFPAEKWRTQTAVAVQQSPTAPASDETTVARY
jgi:hypothetical protein